MKYPQLEGLHCGSQSFSDHTPQALPQCEALETLHTQLCCLSWSPRVCRDTVKSPQLADCLQFRLSHTGPDWLSLSNSSDHVTKLRAVGALLAHGCPLHTLTLQQRSTEAEDADCSPSLQNRGPLPGAIWLLIMVKPRQTSENSNRDAFDLGHAPESRIFSFIFLKVMVAGNYLNSPAQEFAVIWKKNMVFWKTILRVSVSFEGKANVKSN